MARSTPTTRPGRVITIPHRPTPPNLPAPAASTSKTKPRRLTREQPRSKPKNNETPQQARQRPNLGNEPERRQNPEDRHARGKPEDNLNPATALRPAAPSRDYSSSEIYPLATRRAYSLAINISSGDSTMQLTRASLPPTFTPTPCGVTNVER